MSTIAEDVIAKAKAYLLDDEQLSGQEPTAMMVDFVIEKYVQHRNFPTNFTQDKIEADIRAHISTVAMAVVDLFAKYGAEGEKSHDEKNIKRTYENAYVSESLFNDVLPYVRAIGR